MPRLTQDGDPSILEYIRAIWFSQGKNFSRCELCGKQGKTEIHHTKYIGATINDLVLACRKCNMQSANKGLP